MTPQEAAFYQQLGRRIQSLRIQRNITQKQLGDRLLPAVTRASVANLESGKQRILVHTLVQLSELLECELQEVIPSFPRSTRNSEQVLDGQLRRLELRPTVLSRIRRKLISSVPATKQ